MPGHVPAPYQVTRARVRLRAELWLPLGGSGPAWATLPRQHLKPSGDVSILSLFSPATPGPCTQPRTSWKTSATCSTTWLTSWMQCWTEACSLLPLPASSRSTSAPRDGGRAELAPSGASRSLQPPPSPHFALRLGTQLPLLAHPWLRISRASAAAGWFPRGSGVSHQTGSRRRAQRGCACGPGGHGEALAPLHRAEEPPQGTFLFPRCIAESCLLLFIPCQQCVKGETSPGSRHRAGYLLSRSQPWQGLTAAKRRQGLLQFGSLWSEKETFCFICCFSKRLSVRQRVIQADRNPSGGTHKPLEMGLAQLAKQWMLRHGPAGRGGLPAPSPE